MRRIIRAEDGNDDRCDGNDRSAMDEDEARSERFARPMEIGSERGRTTSNTWSETRKVASLD